MKTERIIIEVLQELERAETIHPNYPTNEFKALAIWQEKFWTICRIKYNVDYNKMTEKGKSEPIVFIRQIYGYLLHKNMFLSDREIAVQINRERSTVVTTRQGVEISIKLKEAKFMRVYKHFKHLAQ